MELTDEHEMLIQYSEMAAFDFASEEFQKIRKDYIECKNFFAEVAWRFDEFVSKFRPAKSC